LNEPLQLTRGDQIPLHEVEPNALARLPECLDAIHGVSLPSAGFDDTCCSMLFLREDAAPLNRARPASKGSVTEGRLALETLRSAQRTGPMVGSIS
jgi:hypothetical protein